jgi:8-amino-7-oxononanoate synthase
MSLLDALIANAKQREAQFLRRARRIHEQRDGPWAVLNEQRVLNFSSNDYLGFAQHTDIISAFKKGAEQYGVGSAGSALVSGYFSPHRILEEQAAELFGYEACLYVGSGYLANIGVLQTLLDAQSVCVQDKLNHACLIDGARFSGCTLKRFAHQDLSSAENFCSQAQSNNIFLVSDGVFSMDGDVAALSALASIAKHSNATLMIDDAHGVGVLGDKGLGSVHANKLNAQQVPILIVPAGKALGGQGALILSKQIIIQHLVETARPYLFSTAPAPAMAAALSQSLHCLQQQPEHHARLQTNIQHFTTLAVAADLPILPSHSTIQPLMVGSNERALWLSEQMMQKGFWLSAIRPPTVPAGKARLRITLTALHEAEHISALVTALQSALQQSNDLTH